MNKRYWLLAECKRANPDYSDWLFLSAGFVRRNHSERFIVDQCRLENEKYFLVNGSHIRYLEDTNAFHLGIDVRKNSNTKHNGGKTAIEDAASQVCRGANGMINYLRTHPKVVRAHRQLVLLPVIFTTARLFAARADLGDCEVVDLATGTVDPGKLQLEEVPFVYYQYHLSPGIKYEQPEVTTINNLSDLLALEAIRTIPVVNAASVATFLRSFDPEQFDVAPVVAGQNAW